MTVASSVLSAVEELLGRPVVSAVTTDRTDRRGTVLTMLEVVCGADPATRRVVVKQYRADDEEGDGQWAAEVGLRLERAGMRAPATFRVAATHGVRPGTLVCEHAPGAPWRSTLGGAAAEPAATAVGQWLHALQQHRLELPPGVRRGPADTARQLQALSAVPELGGPLAQLGPDLLRALDQPQPQVTSHGNFHPDNLFVTAPPEPVVTAIDLDTAAAREPAYDVGYGVVQLVIRSTRRPGREHGLAAARAFLRGYLSAGGQAPPERIAVQAGRALVQGLHYEAVAMRRPDAAREQLLPLLQDLPEWIGPEVRLRPV